MLDCDHLLTDVVDLLRELFVLELGADDGRITLKSIVFVEFGLALMTLPTERHVHVVSTNHALDVLSSGAECEAGAFLTELADGG